MKLGYFRVRQRSLSGVARGISVRSGLFVHFVAGDSQLFLDEVCYVTCYVASLHDVRPEHARDSSRWQIWLVSSVSEQWPAKNRCLNDLRDGVYVICSHHTWPHHKKTQRRSRAMPVLHNEYSRGAFTRKVLAADQRIACGVLCLSHPVLDLVILMTLRDLKFVRLEGTKQGSGSFE